MEELQFTCPETGLVFQMEVNKEGMMRIRYLEKGHIVSAQFTDDELKQIRDRIDQYLMKKSKP